MIDSKTLAILLTLLSNKKISLYELTIKTRFSIKDIKECIDKLNHFLKLNKKLQINCQEGYYFISNFHGNNDSLIELLNSEEIYLSQEDRLDLIVLYSFIRVEFLSNNHFQDLLKVSKNTVLSDIKHLRQYLETLDITLSYSRTDGYFLEGNNSNIKQLVINIIFKLTSNAIGIWALEYVLSYCSYANISALLFKQVSEYSKEQKLIPFEDRLKKIIYCIIFIAYSYRNGYREVTTSFTKENKTFDDLTSLILEIIEGETTSIKFSVEDKNYFKLLLQGCFEGSNDNYIFFDELTNEIIKNMETLTLLDFGNNVIFRKNLKSHLIPAYYRLVAGLPEYNSFTNQIKNENYDLYNIVSQSLEPLKSVINTNIPEDEIVYFVIHFGGYLQNSIKLKKRKYKAIILCPNGVSSSLIIKENLKRIFSNIDFSFSTINDFFMVKNSEYDFIFSTVNINTDVPHYLVSTIMSDEQLIELESMIRRDFPDLNNDENNIDEIVEIIKKYALINGEKELRFALKKFIAKEKKRKDVRPLLDELITEKMYQYSEENLKWEDAINLASKPLVNTGQIEERYSGAMIDKVKEFGPFINLGKGIAIPHARPDEGVNKIGMSMLVLKNPIYLLDDPSQEINVLICIAAVDNDTHLRALSQLTMLLRDNDNVDKLKTSKEFSDIKNLLKN